MNNWHSNNKCFHCCEPASRELALKSILQTGSFYGTWVHKFIEASLASSGSSFTFVKNGGLE
jgi:hypothetical protein